MKKQKIQLLALLLVLAALAGVFIGVKKYNEAQAEKPAEKGIDIVDISYDDMVDLVYDYEGETYHYEKVDGTWYLAEDHSKRVKETRIKSMLSGLAAMKSKQELHDVTDYSQYGLEPPKRTIVVSTADKSLTIYVGDSNAMTSSCYIQLSGVPDTVYIVEHAVMNSFAVGTDSLLEADEEGTEGSAEGTEGSAEGTKDSADAQ